MTRRLAQILAGIAMVGLIAWGTSYVLERVLETPPATNAPAPPPREAARAHIAATLFYVAEGGTALVRAQRDVPLAASVVEQGRQILIAQLGDPAPAPLASPFPTDTTLRAFYVTDRGDAFVDLSSEVSTGHPGGSQAEILTVYAVVNVVSANLPAIRRVQILINGQEVDTLAGHVDLRAPLAPDLSLVVDDAADERGPSAR